MDLRRRDYGVRDMVRRIEQAIIDTLADYGIEARGDVNAPGVYVGARKIASLGLRIKNHATYHACPSTSAWTWPHLAGSTRAATLDWKSPG